MKKLLIAGLLVFTGACNGINLPSPFATLEAQSLPIDAKVQWSPSVVDTTHGAPTGYRVTFDAVVKDEGNPPLNIACSCIQVIRTITNPGMHTVSVVAYNEWGDSTPIVLNVLVTVPNSASGLKVTK